MPAYVYSLWRWSTEVVEHQTEVSAIWQQNLHFKIPQIYKLARPF